MNEKTRHRIRKIGKLAKKIFGGLILAVLITFWVFISGFNLYCATTPLACNSSSLTWWSMFLSAFGLPILAVQMYLLRKTFEEGTWKPEISVGIFLTTPRPDDIMKLDELPKKAIIRCDDFIDEDFQPISKIIIRNSGKAAAKNIKIQVSLIEYPDYPATPELEIETFEEISVTNVKVANLENMIHSGDFNEFRFAVEYDTYNHRDEMKNLVNACHSYLRDSYRRYPPVHIDIDNYPYLYKSKPDEEESDESESVEYKEIIEVASSFSNSLIVGKNIFQVKVWADGINPVSEKLVLEIADYPNELKTLIKAIASESEKFHAEYH
jgi:hypothetical protein